MVYEGQPRYSCWCLKAVVPILKKDKSTANKSVCHEILLQKPVFSTPDDPESLSIFFGISLCHWVGTKSLRLLFLLVDCTVLTYVQTLPAFSWFLESFSFQVQSGLLLSDTKWPAGILTQGVTFIPLFGQKNIMTGNFSSFKTPIWKTGRLAFLCSVAEIFVFLSNQTSSVYAAEGILKSMLHLKQPFCLKFYVKFRVNENLYDWILSLDTVDIITCTT